MWQTPSTLNQGKLWWSLAAWYYYVSKSDKDTSAKVSLIAQLTMIWGIERVMQLGTGIAMRTPLAAAVWGPVLAGGIISAAIDGEEGLENYASFIDNVSSPEQPIKLQSAAVQTGIGVTAAKEAVVNYRDISGQHEAYQSYHARMIANLRARYYNNLTYAVTGSHHHSGPLFDINDPEAARAWLEQNPGVLPAPGNYTEYLEEYEMAPYPV